MKALKASEFPELQRVFSGYLHEDFLEVHESAAAALRAFQDDASPLERKRLRIEVLRFLDRIGQIPLKELRALLAALGCRWIPPSRKALVELLVDVVRDAGSTP